MSKELHINKDLLTFEYMEKFKGILIILVVIGHISGLTSANFHSALYSFHVSSFFFLPFLFNNDKLTFINILKVFKRYYIPYTVFFLLSFLLYTIFMHKSFSLLNVFISFFTGTLYSLKDSIGIGAYWFFPALIALLMSIMLYNSLSIKWKKVFLFISLLSHLVIGIFVYPDKIFRIIPFDIYIPLYLFFLGFIIKMTVLNITLSQKLLVWITLVFMLSLIISYSYGENFTLASPYFPNIFTRPFDFLLRDILMLSGFFSILFISKYIPYTTIFGQYSIAIYTIHPLAIQLVNKLLHTDTIIILISKLFIVLFISIIFTQIIYKIGINKFIYPK
jgi:fucose 4-O-acetylase-like acetyltransferase